MALPIQESKQERRREPRYRTLNRIVPVTVDGRDGFDAKILDVSRSGVRLKARQAIAKDCRLVIQIDHLEVEGSVCYCEHNPDGTFDVGLKIYGLWSA